MHTHVFILLLVSRFRRGRLHKLFELPFAEHTRPEEKQQIRTTKIWIIIFMMRTVFGDDLDHFTDYTHCCGDNCNGVPNNAFTFLHSSDCQCSFFGRRRFLPVSILTSLSYDLWFTINIFVFRTEGTTNVTLKGLHWATQLDFVERWNKDKVSRCVLARNRYLISLF